MADANQRCRIASCLATVALFLTGSILAQTTPPELIPDTWSRQVVLSVPPARPKAPVIDGHVTYKEWYYASSLGGFIDVDTGNLSDLPVRMYVCYDDQFVYMGFVIYRPAMNPTPRATFQPGQHEHIWWKDDNLELVLWPGRPEKGIEHFYAFCGNSIGAWSNMRGEIEGTGGDSTWPGQWVYKASRAGRDNWHAELAIPIKQFPACEKPGPGAVWFADVMNQQVTPAKKMIDLGLIWNLQEHGYRSQNLARLVFVDEGPIVRPHGLGRLRRTGEQTQETVGLRQVFYNQGKEPYTLDGEIQLFRAPAPRPAGALAFFDLWDRIIKTRKTGKPVIDPKQEVQAFRSEADLLRELNERFKFVAERKGTFTVAPGKAGYFNLERPVETGEYIVAYRFSDAKTGEVMNAQVVPYAILPALDLSLRPHFLKHEKLRAEASLRNTQVAEGDKVQFALRRGDQVLATASAAVAPQAEAVHAYLDTHNFELETEATVTALLVRADGTERMTSSKSIRRPATPEWYGNQIGRSKVVPPPFEAVRVVGDETVQLWERRIEFGEDGLPRSVLARGTELLARPIRLDLGDLTPAWELRCASADDRDAVFEAQGAAGGLRFALRSTVRYDGTTRFDLRVTPDDTAAQLSRLVLEVPLVSRYARLMTHHTTWTDPARSDTKGFAGSLDRWLDEHIRAALEYAPNLAIVSSYGTDKPWRGEDSSG